MEVLKLNLHTFFKHEEEEPAPALNMMTKRSHSNPRCTFIMHILYKKDSGVNIYPLKQICVPVCALKSPRVVSTCSSCLITTPPAGCAFSISSSSKPSPYPGFMVRNVFIMESRVKSNVTTAEISRTSRVEKDDIAPSHLMNQACRFAI